MSREFRSGLLFAGIAVGLVVVVIITSRQLKPSTEQTTSVEVNPTANTIGLVTNFVEVRTSTFVESVPNNNALLAVAPNTVRVMFSETLGTGSSLTVINGQGQYLQLGRPTFSDDRRIMTVLLAKHASGPLTVSYRACSLDGICSDGRFGFVVRPVTP
ncbi:MAG: copper resistance protein CopC [Candidatus Kerfeldbacteria bacterium]|nr:copper resistance protein CopC [Candidatus Kerfeldbacteria bacterium]